jgi:hypothetical protein
VADDAIAALCGLWNSEPGLQVLCSGRRLFADEAPAGTALPYAVATTVSGPVEELNHGAGYTLTQTVQISYFAATRAEAMRGIREIRERVRLATLTIGGRATREVFVEGGSGQIDPTPSPAGGPVFQQTCDFLITWPTD